MRRTCDGDKSQGPQCCRRVSVVAVVVLVAVVMAVLAGNGTSHATVVIQYDAQRHIITVSFARQELK